MLILEKIDISPLLKAQSKFEQFRQNIETEQEKAGVVQAFEYCYELSWKMIKRVLAEKGANVSTPRDAFREGAKLGLISTPEVWFEFLLLRNLTSHTYNEDNLAKVVDASEGFANELDYLVNKLSNLS
jgi:nucleotidyltransferase substrate binding protein (TIGR01987 family)